METVSTEIVLISVEIGFDLVSEDGGGVTLIVGTPFALK